MKQIEGLWIPLEILQIKELNLLSKAIISMIINLDNENGCTANNQYFANMCGCSQVQVSLIIRFFETIEILKVEDGNSFKRKIKFNKIENYTVSTFKNFKGTLKNYKSKTFKNLKADNIYNIYNIINNIYLEKEKEKEKMKIKNYQELKNAIKEDYLYKVASIYKLNKNTIYSLLDAFVNINKDKKSNEFKFCQHFENWLKTDKGQQAINNTRMTSNITNNYQQD